MTDKWGEEDITRSKRYYYQKLAIIVIYFLRNPVIISKMIKEIIRFTDGLKVPSLFSFII